VCVGAAKSAHLSAVRLNKPADGALFYIGEPIVLGASTTPAGGKDRELCFFDGSEPTGCVRRPHATLTWTNAALGIHTLTATMRDNEGVTIASESVTIRVRPVNDDFTSSFVIEGLNVVTNGTNLGAGPEEGEPSGGNAGADASVWYSWTAPVSGIVVVSVAGSSFSGHPLGVYTGTSLSNLVSLGESVYEFIPVDFVAHAGITYYIEVTGVSQNIPDGVGPFTLSVRQTPAPPNDDFANAIVLSESAMTVTGSNVGATSEPGEPEHSYLGLANSVWWTWTAPAKGRLSLDFRGSDFLPVVSLYTGTTVSNLALIGRSYTAFISLSPVSRFYVEAGQTYYIVLVGHWYPAVEGNVRMDLSFSLGPPNDRFVDRIPLTGLVATASGSNTTATAEEGEPSSNGHTVWWTWTAPVSGPVSIGTSGSSVPPWVSVYTGTELTNLAVVTTAFARVTFSAIAGTEYQISVDANRGGQLGQIALALVAGFPSNDAFTNRIVLSGTNSTIVGAIVEATRETNEPVHGQLFGSNSIWWSWSAPAAGTLTVNVTGDGFNPTWAVYKGSSLRSLSLVADSYDWVWGVRSSASIPVQPDVPLQLAVDRAVDDGAGLVGIVSVNLVFVGLPSNDNFSSRIPISGTSAHVTGNTSGATREPGEPNHAGYPGGHSIWWSWTAPTAGRLTLDAFGSSVTTVAAVYVGDIVSTLTNLGGGNATFSKLDYDCDGGVTYQIALDHWYSDSFGAVNLNLLFSSVRLISPTNEAVFHNPSEIVLSATTTAWDGDFAKMEFLAGDSVIGIATNVPYTMSWSNPPLGNHYLRARVTDSSGLSRASPPVLIYNRPANDDFASRIPILGDAAVVRASGINGTLESGEPNHGPVNWESVWWTWTAPGNGRATVSRPSDINLRFVLLNVYTGLALADLVLITNTPSNLSGTAIAAIAFDAVQGTAYQIAIAGSFFDKSDVPVTFSFARMQNFDSVYQSASASAGSPFLSQPLRSSPTKFSFLLNGRRGSRYTILASTNLSSPPSQWLTIMTTNLSETSVIIEDNDADAGQRFYRAKLEP
jgi:hypothetical protein